MPIHSIPNAQPTARSQLWAFPSRKPHYSEANFWILQVTKNTSPGNTERSSLTTDGSKLSLIHHT